MFTRRSTLTGLGAAALTGLLAPRARAALPLKVGALVPEASIWGRALKAWAADLGRRTRGALQPTLSFHADARGEPSLAARVRRGDLQGGLCSAAGLGALHAHALQMPGVFSGWPRVDAAREALKAELRAELEAGGLVMGGRFDLGELRLFSRAPVRLPADLTSARTLTVEGESVAAALLTEIGAPASTTPLIDVSTALSTGRLDAFIATAAFAEAVKWTVHMNALLDVNLGYAASGLVFHAGFVGGLAPELRAALLDSAAAAGAAGQAKARSEDAAARARLGARLAVAAPTADEGAAWASAFAAARARMGAGPFTPELVARVEALG
jgi:TRAP-type C4-dicarboxylate transport system substrate-binding protein